MDDFVAIDVETANQHPTSICSIGAVKVEGGRIVDRFYEFVKPTPDYYLSYFTRNIHGISKHHTSGARTFDRVWGDLDKFISGLPLVAHNKAFDERCIIHTFKAYGMEYPGYAFHCTLTAAKRQIPRSAVSSYSLPYLCEFFAIPFDNHHNALADAEACAKLALALL